MIVTTAHRMFCGLSCFAAAALLLGCAKSEEANVDHWGLSVPSLELKTARGVSQSIALSRDGERTLIKTLASAQNPWFADDTSLLRFAANDVGLALDFLVSCEVPLSAQASAAGGLSSATQPSWSNAGRVSIEQTMSIGLFLPRQVFAPAALRLPWRCGLRFTAHNGHGSTHRFALDSLALSLQGVLERGEAKSADSDRLGLSCSSWWTEGSTSLRGEAAIADLAHRGSVSGIDTREIERRPLCTLYSVGNGRLTIASVRRVTLGAPRITVQSAIALPKGELLDLLERPIYAYQVESQEDFPLVLFFSHREAAVQVSVLSNAIDPKITDWSRSLQAPLLFEVRSPARSQTTPAGLYIFLEPRQKATVWLRMNRSAYCPVDTRYPETIQAIRFAMKKPLAIATLANPIGGVSVSSVTRSLVSGTAALVENAVLDSVERDSVLVPLVESGEITLLPTGPLPFFQLATGAERAKLNQPVGVRRLCFKNKDEILRAPLEE